MSEAPLRDSASLYPEQPNVAIPHFAFPFTIDIHGHANVLEQDSDAERKEDMRRRGLPSPDRADAVAMALVQFEQVVDVDAHRRGRLITDGILNMEW